MTRPVCYIFGAGEYFSPPPSQIKDKDFVIAADGGYLFLKEHNIPVNLVVGDFDSMSCPKEKNIEVITLPAEKDETDMGFAINEGIKRGYKVFYIYGGTGGRLDHTLANIQCICDIAKRGGRGYLFDKDTVITAIHNDTITLSAATHGTVSVICHGDTALGVNLKGLKYPLVDAVLRNTYPLGVSNEFIGTVAQISVEHGTLVIIYPNYTEEISQ